MWHFNKNIFFLIIYAFSQVAFSQAEVVTSNSNQISTETYSGRQDNNWIELQKGLGNLKTKLDAQQSIVKELLDSKKNNKGPISQSQVDQLGVHDKKLQDLTKEYSQKLNEFELKYPEKGQAFGRQYSRKKNLPLDTAEEKAALSSRVVKINRKIKTKYHQKIETTEIGQELLKSEAKKTQLELPKKPKPHDVTDKITVVK